MSYYKQLIQLTLEDIRKKNLNQTIRKDSIFDELIKYLTEHDVDQFYQHLKENTLNESVRYQYDLLTDIVQEIAK